MEENEENVNVERDKHEAERSVDETLVEGEAACLGLGHPLTSCQAAVSLHFVFLVAITWNFSRAGRQSQIRYDIIDLQVSGVVWLTLERGAYKHAAEEELQLVEHEGEHGVEDKEARKQLPERDRDDRSDVAEAKPC